MGIENKNNGMPELEVSESQRGGTSLFGAKKKMSYEELIKILSMDGTHEQIKEAIKNEELTKKECHHLYDFLLAENEEKARKAYEKVRNDVLSAPVYESKKEEEKSWALLRLDLADQINNIQRAQIRLREDIERLEDEMWNALASAYGKEKANQDLEAIKKIIDDISDVSKHNPGKLAEEFAKQLHVSYEDSLRYAHETMITLTDGAEPKEIAQSVVGKAMLSKAEPSVKAFCDATIERIKEDEKKLDIKVKQHSALSIMHSEAKSPEAQQKASIFMRNTQQTRDEIRRRQKMLEGNVRKAIEQTKQLNLDRSSFPLFIKTEKELRLEEAQANIKEMNKIQKKIDEAERKLLARANDLSAKEFRRESFGQAVKGFADAKKPPARKLELLQDIKQAQEFLSNPKHSADKEVAKRQKELEKLYEEREEAKKAVTRSLENVADVMRTRKQKVMEVARETYEQFERGDLDTISERQMEKIEQNLQAGLDSTFIESGSLSDDLRQFMIEHGFDDLIKIEDVDQSVDINIDDFDVINAAKNGFSHKDQGDHTQDAEIGRDR